MKLGIAALALLAGIVSCSCPCRDVPDDPVVVAFERPPAEIRVEEPERTRLEYLAWCADEERALGDWQADRGEAASRAVDHEQRAEGHRTTILWRQSPQVRMAPNP